MRITTDRLILRNIEIKDIRDLAENVNDRDVWYYTTAIPYPYSRKEAREYINSQIDKQNMKLRKDYSFAIELKSLRKIIGIIGLHKVDRINKKAEIGYWLGKNYRRKGILTEAERAVLEFGFIRLKLNKIAGSAIVTNEASNALFRKFGFKKVGLFKEELVKINKKLRVNKKVDIYWWELLRRDWQRMRSMRIKRNA